MTIINDFFFKLFFINFVSLNILKNNMENCQM
jgi:hypothetical protein